MDVDARQRAALTAICDTFNPGDGAAVPSARALGAVAELLAGAQPRARDRRQLARLLSVWDSGATVNAAQPADRLGGTPA
ncbi:hypothetical protein GCM10023205_84710 [Yinghuangia aomiensis]|uniref:Uncharacterized protein n=1 Tax=Yinghuangia aomiensis TaxID=676205 RepID=A0ABP9IHJ0_9ACTN